MPMSPKGKLKIFYCYARKDQELRDELERHLSDLTRFYDLETWFDRRISPGENWEENIDAYLNKADLVLLLISPDFLASDYCYNKEMPQALARHNRGEAKVIPIMLRPILWKTNPFSGVQMLPRDAQPVTIWNDKDSAFYNIAIGVDQIIGELLSSRAKLAQKLLKDQNESFQKNRVFIIHSNQDYEFSRRLTEDLRQLARDESAVWYDSGGGLIGGDVWWSVLKKELYQRNIFIIILSPDALKSLWVQKEINIAQLRRETSLHKKEEVRIFPILCRTCTIPSYLNSLHTVSFLPPKTYENSLQELIEELR